MNDKLNETLQLLGLSKNESSVYLALLKQGQTTAYVIAKNSEIKRPTVYLVLDELRKKGVVLKVPNPKRQIFIARPPHELLAQQEEQLRQIKNILPQLAGLMKQSRFPIKILMFEGDKELVEAVNYRLKELANTEVLAFYAKAPRQIPGSVLQTYLESNRHLYENGIRLRGFAPTHPSLKIFRGQDKKYGFQIVNLPLDMFSADISLLITKLYVSFFFHKNKQVMIIENEALVKTMKEIFEMVWVSFSRGNKRGK